MLTETELNTIISNKIFKEQVNTDVEIAKKLSVFGVPYFRIYNLNKKQYVNLTGYHEYQSLKEFVDKNTNTI
ncbi:hypothetical protein [Francisella sp. SYW-9]|uniref:hypothetical protein n=1 Tax=Francisella sp. SYW-9 TaxID=2610888 RepID=UPI00123CDA0E|nr:hypothetical protein [Francisella sp. SYW-9]